MKTATTIELAIVALTLFLGSLLNPAATAADKSPLVSEKSSKGNEKNPKLAAEVESGKRSVANAAWWGFDKNDSTAALQAAIDSGAKKVVVPKLDGDWIVSNTILLAGDQEIFFEPGVTISAMKGRFIGRGESLMSASNKQNITLRGPGATLLMHKADYQKAPYQKSEWRHALSIRGCRNIKVIGLAMKDSGGDGIYLGSTSALPGNIDIQIKDVTCDGNNRQGLSVISAENLLVENCRFINTSGTAPQAGIDFEPNQSKERLVNCVVRNCLVDNNAGPGIYAYLKHLSKESADISILVENCQVKNCGGYGIGGGAVRDQGPGGFMEFKNVTVDQSNGPGAHVYDKSSTRAVFRFVNCTWKNTARKTDHPLSILLRRPNFTNKQGNIEFLDCVLLDDRDRPFLKVRAKNDLPVAKIKGAIKVTNPHGSKIDWGPASEDVELKIR
ncbi:MAG: right-handed parallel beta-helix repeat-containing protein [Pirellulales bacterium]|nr:right-handed parallel beta-helix repeat-containing protein [Pirellulales bacterium]